jgi:hypothetical protein
MPVLELLDSGPAEGLDYCGMLPEFREDRRNLPTEEEAKEIFKERAEKYK